jgi:hypothetical protein
MALYRLSKSMIAMGYICFCIALFLYQNVQSHKGMVQAFILSHEKIHYHGLKHQQNVACRQPTKQERAKLISVAAATVNKKEHSVIAAAFNFGLVSSRDNVLYTSHCPGYNKDGLPITYTELEQQISGWLNYMKHQGITNVIALLDDNELDLPLNTDTKDETLIHQSVNIRDIYTKANLPFLIQPMRDLNAYQVIMEYIHSVASQSNGKVVVHCTGGVGRAGRVASAWLVYR